VAGWGKRVRLSVGKVAVQAENKRLRKQAELNAVSKGLIVASDKGDADEAGKRPIALLAANFLEEISLTRKPKTFKGYEIALAYFQESCTKRYLEDLEKLDLLKFTAFLHNKFPCLLTFLSENGIPKLVGKNARPQFVNQQVEMFEHGELERLFHACSEYRVTLYNFLLMTGLREKEAMYYTWNDVNLKAGTINMRWKPQYDFEPKAYREREVLSQRS
jgi:integrase/recombinase XerD